MRGEWREGQPGEAPALTPPPLGRASCSQLTPPAAATLHGCFYNHIDPRTPNHATASVLSRTFCRNVPYEGIWWNFKESVKTLVQERELNLNVTSELPFSS